MNKYTEIIHKYHNGEMNADEKKDFESQLQNNAELKLELDIHKQILKGIDRAGIKTEINKGFKKGSFKSKSGKWFTGIVIGLTFAAAVLVVKNNFIPNNNQSERYELNEENKKSWAEADKQLNSEIFTIKINQDTVIETKGGIIITIPANAFLNKKALVIGEIELELKEALTPFDIMKAGLSTTSDGKLLETGGMFYINARQDGINLSIDQKKGVYVSVPNFNPKKEMMLFEGKRMENGQINWVNPKPFENNLQPVNILSLNFYPPHFLDSLKQFGFDTKNKRLTDSIYYSFVCHLEMDELIGMRISKADTVKYYSHISKSLVNDSNNIIYNVANPPSEISPSHIHSIWDIKFNNTLLATKEFEERLQTIFKTCNPNIFELYTKNLNKKMYELDSIALTMTSLTQFNEFYRRHDGGISINDSHLKKLQQYMKEKQKIYDDVAKTTLSKLYEKENIRSQKALQELNEHNNKEATRINKIFSEELEMNMKDAYRKLGNERYPPTIPTRIAKSYLSTAIVSTGWKNVDVYVVESTVNRTTLNYTERETGKKAVIKYEPFIVNVTHYKDYDRVVAYLIPNKLSSFQLMLNTNAVFKENLNELINYGAVVFGFKDNDVYYYPIAEAKSGDVTVTLNKMKRDELNTYRTLNAGGTISLVSELNFQILDLAENKRKQVVAKREEITAKLWTVVFPCYIDQEVPVSK